MSFLSIILGDSNERYIKSTHPIVEHINSLEPEFQRMTDEALKEKTVEFKKRLFSAVDGTASSGEGGETLDDILPEAFAAVREAARRTLGQRHFDVQLIGGIVLHKGKIAEMKTGEGKTLVATLPLYLNALSGKGCHLVTPNDYLSRVGGGWMGAVYSALGVTTGVISHDFSGIYDPSFTQSPSHGDPRLDHWRPVSRTEAYKADITYGTNNEFGFDFLRDNLAYSIENTTQREHNFAIVDEVDSILIDEARTPLIISAPDEESADLYKTFARITPRLEANTDYIVDEKLKAVSINEVGIEKVEKILGVKNLYEEKGFRYVRYLEQALKAQALFRRDKEYVVKDGEVIIVDEFTGRLMPGRRWSEGLHQAVEAKEGVVVQRESRTLATITFQNYFRMYSKLAGMTGTAVTNGEEFHKVYNLDVIIIPTNRANIRKDFPDLVFRTEAGKMRALVREIKERHGLGQPILVGTVSIQKNEHLAALLVREGVSHELLNAKNHEREAMIIAQTGRLGAVTIATNMAGRGVDILLGGNPSDPAEAERVKELGGLHVIGTERHEARRIDNQLRGRSGRQGDPGSTQFFLSLEDEIMRIFGSNRISSMMESFGIPEDEPIINKMVTKAIEGAQAKIEGFHFDSRKHILEYDDVMNKQRDFVYRLRRGILAEEAEPPKEKIFEFIEEEIAGIIQFHTAGYRSDWNVEEIGEIVRSISGQDEDIAKKLEEFLNTDEDEMARGQIIEYVTGYLKNIYEERERSIGEAQMRNLEKTVLLQTIDMLWMDHLDIIEHLRDSVRLRAYGQRDPLVEYKNEGSKLFKELKAAIRSQVVNTIFKVGSSVQISQPRRIEARKPEASSLLPGMNSIASSGSQGSNTPPPPKAEVGRNDPCPCGSGKKYKKCHGK
ncbi:MAG: preprotein translocase subunit SecA [Candidatus Sungbacteria bacterium RIFCSPLOWO2_01_FULL_47_32]|nr:MAG: preprotein translocase subunit SecA [Candidatus Sungbacteria bacterium RIFCSPLOWO2_01_FULL_47_32]